MNKTGIPYLDYTWNPCGFGCSKGCDGCWARRMAKRMQCPHCKGFWIHFHPERLDQPAKEKKPSVIGVQFTGELFDKCRIADDIRAVLNAGADAKNGHTMVYLTQQVEVAHFYFAGKNQFRLMDNEYLGLTIRNQAEADERLPVFMKIPGKLWLSIEPQWGPVDLELSECVPHENDYDDSPVGYVPCDVCGGFSPLHARHCRRVAGVIVGCDNRAGVPFELAWARSIVEQCQAAEVPVYVKQLRIGGKLVHDPKDFPKDLRLRQLPWKLRTKKP